MADERARPGLERFTFFGTWGGAVLGAAGAILAAIGHPVGDVGLLILLGGLALTLAAVCTGAPLRTLRTLQADVTGGRAYDLLRGQRSLRIASILLSFLVFSTTVVVLLVIGSRVGAVHAPLEGSVLERGLLVLGAALCISSAVAHLQALRTPIERDLSGGPFVLALLSLGLAAAVAIVGLLAWSHQAGFLRPWMRLDRPDTGLIALVGFALTAFGLARVRTLPGLPALFAEEREAGRTTARRASTVLVPAVLAFALLLVVFLLFLLFGIGVGDLLTSVGQNPLLLAILAFLLLAIVASLVIGTALGRTAEKEQPLFKALPDAKRRRIVSILAASGTAGLALLVCSILAYNNVFQHGLWLHLLCFGLLSMLGPYGFYAAHEYERIRRLEERFPDFLRDIASSHKGGLTLNQSVTVAARGEYGPLTPEVHKMADQLSWNVPFHEALERFSDRVQTPLVQRAVSLISEADRSGGGTTDVLLAAARDAREIKNLENERRITMNLYTLVVYITFFVFLGVAAVLYGQFAPSIVHSAQAVHSLATGSAGGFKLGGNNLTLDQYLLFYFSAAVVQGLGDGILAGLLGTGKATQGLRHSFFMVLAAYITFAVLL